MYIIFTALLSQIFNLDDTDSENVDHCMNASKIIETNSK